LKIKPFPYIYLGQWIKCRVKPQGGGIPKISGPKGRGLVILGMLPMRPLTSVKTSAVKLKFLFTVSMVGTRYHINFLKKTKSWKCLLSAEELLSLVSRPANTLGDSCRVFSRYEMSTSWE
jgi:hypothetical protein